MEQNYVTVILCILLVMGTSLTAQWGRSSPPPAVGIGDPLHFQIEICSPGADASMAGES